MADPVAPKNPLTSKMNIVAGLQLLASVLALLGGSEFVQQFPKTAAALVGINASVLIVLRFFTSVPISWCVLPFVAAATLASAVYPVLSV